MHLAGDTFLASPFRLEWADDSWSENERDETTRAVAERAASILRAARFVGLLHDHQDVEAETRIWLRTDTVPLQVAVWWEEARTRFWFAVVDAVRNERVALVVFRDVASTTLEDMRADEADFLAAVRSLVPEEGGIPLERLAARYRFGEDGIK